MRGKKLINGDNTIKVLTLQKKMPRVGHQNFDVAKNFIESYGGRGCVIALSCQDKVKWRKPKTIVQLC